MASFWKHKHVRQVLAKEIEDNFTDKDTDEVLKNGYSDVQILIGKLSEEEEVNKKEDKECDNFLNALEAFFNILKFAQTNCNQLDNKFKLKLTEKLIDSLVKPSKHVFLAGEWVMLDQQKKAEIMGLLDQLKDQIQIKKREIEEMIELAGDPWSNTAVTNLINGKTEKEEEVLGLLSSEGVEGVALRIEMLVESGMFHEALKAVSTVVIALLSEEMILQSYVSTSAPSIVDRLVDIFIILSCKLNKSLRLFKVLKLIGLTDVNKIYIRRISHYMSGATTLQPLPNQNQDTKTTSPSKTEQSKTEEDKENEDGEDVKEEKEEDLNQTVEEDSDDLEDRFKMLEKGRCENLMTEDNCLKALEVIMQWSLASMAVQDISINLQEYLINEWMDKCMKNKDKFTEDVEVLLECATQTSFLYTLAHALHKRLKKEVEVRCLHIFVKALTQDINEYEAVKRSKSSKSAMEAKLARAFWLLSDIVYDRTSLSRECVLTGFSIKPDKRALDRIVELAHISGVDQTEADSDTEMDLGADKVKLESNKSGLHCRVTIGEEEEEKKKFIKSYHQARKVQQNSKPLTKVLQIFNSEQPLDKVPFEDFESELKDKSFTVTATKLRTNKPREKKTRNLEGLISIRGELVTEAANYNPLEKPCKSLDSATLNLPSSLTDDLLIVISAPRWHMLTWVMSWPDLLHACKKLLNDPKLREPTEDLKYLNIDYTQFNGWSSDEEVTIYTGIEKGYEEWVLEGPDDGEEKVSESEASSEDEADHKIDWEDYNDVDIYIAPDDYLESVSTEENGTSEDSKQSEKSKDSENSKESEEKPSKSTNNKTKDEEKEKEKDGSETRGRGSNRKRKLDKSQIEDEVCKETPETSSSKVPAK